MEMSIVAAKPPEKLVIPTEAEAGQRAERSGEPSLRDSPSGRHGGQTSCFHGRRRRGARAGRGSAPPSPSRRKVRGSSTSLRPLARLRSGRNDRWILGGFAARPSLAPLLILKARLGFLTQRRKDAEGAELRSNRAQEKVHLPGEPWPQRSFLSDLCVSAPPRFPSHRRF